MNLRNKKIVTILLGLVITSSALFIGINVQSLPLVTHDVVSTESIYMILQSVSGPIVGSSTDAGHEGQIDIFQYSHNLYAPLSSSHGATTVSHTPLAVVKMIDRASVPLWNLISIGEVLPRIQLLFYDVGSIFYFNITLTSVQVISMLSDADIGTHYEIVSFIYGTIYWTDVINDITRSSTWN